MMKTKDLPEIAAALYEKLKADGYSNTVLNNTRWILGHFENYCLKNKIPEITVPIASTFVRDCFGFDYYNLTAPMQSVLRRPLMILIEFEESGNYLKTHQKGSTTEIPLIYRELFLEYRDVINSTSLSRNSRERKLWIFVKYFEYLEQNGILKTTDIPFQSAHEYINSLTSYAPATIRCIKTVLREIYDWMFSRGYTPYSGRQMFPLIRKDPRNKLLSYYSKEEICQMFRILHEYCEKSPGYKNDTFRMAMLLYYCCGFRKSEVLNLRIQDVDFRNGKICILNGKNDVSRIVVASDTLLLELQCYRDKYLSSANQDGYFLHGTKSRRYCESILYSRFHQLLADAQIPPRKDGGRQRLHDIRHTFCVRALEQMQEKGFDLYTSLPLLSRYLGHRHITETEYYLRLLEEHFGGILEQSASCHPGIFPKEEGGDMGE